MNTALEAVATLACALYLGATGYTALVEHPARLACANEVALAQFLESARRTPRYAALALVAAAAGLTRGGMGLTSPWTWGGAALLAIVPVTVIALLPAQRRFADPAWPAQSDETHALLVQWGRRHWLRVGLALAALGLFVFRGT